MGNGTKGRKKVLLVVLLLLLILGSCGAYQWFKPKKVTKKEYQEITHLLIKQTQKGSMLFGRYVRGDVDGSGTGSFDEDFTFEDLCTGFYADAFRELGAFFIKQADEFEALTLRDHQILEAEIQNYTAYKQYFGTYRQIGIELQAFADNVDNGDYAMAIENIEQILGMLETLPIIE